MQTEGGRLKTGGLGPRSLHPFQCNNLFIIHVFPMIYHDFLSSKELVFILILFIYCVMHMTSDNMWPSSSNKYPLLLP